MLPTITQTAIELPPGTRLQFPATLADYEQLVEQLRDRASIRIRFHENQIFLMAPLPEHGNQADVLSDLVKALLRHQQQDWQSFDPITLRQTGLPGVEPDACFYIQNRQAILGKQRIDLNQDPPPDLALEIDLTAMTAIADYVPLAVPEVWIYKLDNLKIYQFANNRYLERDTSQVFPGIPVKDIIPKYVNRAWHVGSSIALREFEQFLLSG